jgi:hypothetical protein
MKHPTLGVYSEAGQRIMAPVGAYVKIVKPEGTFAEVEWDGRHVFMFAVDISERAELVRVASIGASVDGKWIVANISPINQHLAHYHGAHYQLGC